jgi:hypothetical protein
LIAAFVIFVLQKHEQAPLPSPTKESIEEEAQNGWAGSYLHQRADEELNAKIDEKSRVSAFSSCTGNQLVVQDVRSSADLMEDLSKEKPLEPNGQVKFRRVKALGVACR